VTSEATAVIPVAKQRRLGLAEILSVLAVVLGAAALAISLLHAGPKGAAGARGPVGPHGPQGVAGSKADVKVIQQCIPELTQWVQGFNVQTSTNTDNSGTYWLTNAYLDTSGQQVSAGCKKVLGLK
jgi:hypothetical protein